MVKLTVVAGPDTGKVFTPEQETLSIGRGEDCEVTLRDGTVSRRHCTIRRSDPKKFSLSDLYTPNGTFLNEINNRIQTSDLHNGDEIIIGKSWLRVNLLEKAQTAPAAGVGGNEQPESDAVAGMSLPKNWQSGMTVVASRAQYPLLDAARQKKSQNQTGLFAVLKQFFRSIFSSSRK
jgi:pSer/pThr/pTyr-binding forkhead associated (FHA) protein